MRSTEVSTLIKVPFYTMKLIGINYWFLFRFCGAALSKTRFYLGILPFLRGLDRVSDNI